MKWNIWFGQTISNLIKRKSYRSSRLIPRTSNSTFCVCCLTISCLIAFWSPSSLFDHWRGVEIFKWMEVMIWGISRVRSVGIFAFVWVEIKHRLVVFAREFYGGVNWVEKRTLWCDFFGVFVEDRLCVWLVFGRIFRVRKGLVGRGEGSGVGEQNLGVKWGKWWVLVMGMGGVIGLCRCGNGAGDRGTGWGDLGQSMLGPIIGFERVGLELS